MKNSNVSMTKVLKELTKVTNDKSPKVHFKPFKTSEVAKTNISHPLKNWGTQIILILNKSSMQLNMDFLMIFAKSSTPKSQVAVTFSFLRVQRSYGLR